MLQLYIQTTLVIDRLNFVQDRFLFDRGSSFGSGSAVWSVSPIGSSSWSCGCSAAADDSGSETKTKTKTDDSQKLQ